MGEHRLAHKHRLEAARVGRQARSGALIGVVVGTLLIGVGIVRALIFLAFGGSLNAVSPDEIRAAVFYVGGFGVAGALLGPVLPRVRGAFGSYLAFAMAGVIVAFAIMASDKGGIPGHDAIEIILLALLGAAFGCAFGYGFRK